MNCATCKVKKIGPKTAPFGGYLCGNEHMQCKDCTEQLDGQCGICEDCTNFVQMNFDTLKLPEPSAPPLEIEVAANSLFPSALYAHIETQSSISQEQLSMQESRETLSERGVHVPRLEGMQQLLTNSFVDPTPAVRIILNPEECTQIETLFIGNSHKHNTNSNFTFQHRLENGVDPSVAIKTPKYDVEYGTNDRVFLMGGSNCGKGFIDDNDDSNIVLASEIRFMDSTESLQNYYSGGTTHPTVRLKPEEQLPPQKQQMSQPQQPQHTVNQQQMLSAKLLHDSECRNSINPCEFVESYLRSYGPLALCQFPAYSFNHSCHNNNLDNGSTANHYVAPTRSISISTESEPSLRPKKPELPCKYPPTDYFLLQATGVAKPVPGTLPNSNKMDQPSIDIRMQKVLETFQEDSRQLKVSEKPLIDHPKNFTKIHAAETTTLQLQPETVHISSCKLSAEKTNHEIQSQISNSHRALYNPPTRNVVEPLPQFQIIGCSNEAANELIMSTAPYSNLIRPIPASQLNIPRSPIKCPESTCQRMIFVSNFNTHLTVDHSLLPMERIAPCQCKNFFLDPRLAHKGVSKCHLLYLIRDKISGLGSSKFKDFLPLMVMSTRVSLLELCGVSEVESNESVCGNSDFLMIWLTGIVPEECPVSVSLTVWPRSGQVPTCHLVHSGEMYSIRKSQSMMDVWQSGQMLLLSSREVELLTNGSKDMLELQIVVH